MLIQDNDRSNILERVGGVGTWIGSPKRVHLADHFLGRIQFMLHANEKSESKAWHNVIVIQNE